MSKRPGGIKGCKDKTSSWHLISPLVVTLCQQHNVEEKPTNRDAGTPNKASLKINLNASRPSEHPPVRGGGMSKRLGGIIGCKVKTSVGDLKLHPTVSFLYYSASSSTVL